MRPLCSTLVLAALAAGCGREETTGAPGARPAPLVPAFALRSLKSDEAREGRFMIDSEGRVLATGAALDPKAVPEKIRAAALARLGPERIRGASRHVLPDASEAYVIETEKASVGVAADGTIRFVESAVAPEDVPSTVRDTLRAVGGFTPEAWRYRHGNRISDQYVVEGEILGNPHRARIAGTGRLVGVYRVLPAEIEVETLRDSPSVK